MKLETFHISKVEIEQDCILSSSVRALIRCLPENGLRTLVRQFEELFMENYETVNDVQHFPIKIITSSFVPSIRALQLDNSIKKNSVLVNVHKNFKVTRVVVSDAFNLSKEERFDNVTVLFPDGDDNNQTT